MNKKFNKSIFFCSILPYVLVVLLVFTTQSISTSVVLRALKSNAIDIAENSFKANINVIGENVHNAKEIALAVSQNVAEKLEGEKNKENFTRLIDARKTLKKYFVNNGLIENICVQNDENDLLVNFDTVYSSRKNFYNLELKSNSLSGKELLKNSETATGFSAEGICTINGEADVIPFFSPTPLMAERTGSVCVYIKKKALLLPMGDLLSENGGILRITDSKGNVLIEAGGNSELEVDNSLFTQKIKDGRLEKNDFYIFSHTDKEENWKYTLIMPEEYVMKNMKYYQTFSIVFNFIALIIGFALCLFFVLRKSDAYLELMEMLGVDMERFQIRHIISKNEYKYLSEHISKIKNENEELLERDNQNVLRMLLNEEFESEDVIAGELKKHNMEFCHKKYGVINLYHKNKRITGSFADNFNVFILREIQRIIPDAKVYFGERNNTVILFSVNEESFTQTVDMYISKLEIDVLFKYRIPVVFGVGNPVYQLCDIGFMCRQAKDVVKYNLLLDDKKVRYYSSLPEGNIDYYYPVELRNELFDSVLEPSFENARTALRKIQEENFVNRELSLEAITELLTELRSDFKKIGKLRSEQLEFVQDDESISHFFEYAISFFYLLCSETEKEPQSRSKRICREVQRYIEENYTDINLTLPSIAAEFRMHPNYLSSVFKKNTDCSIVTYIERLRVDKAVQLLAEGKHSVNETAQLVGFSNVGTFRRIFKKIKGVTPTDYFKS